MKKVTLVSSKVLLVLAVMFFCALPMSASAAILTVGGACGYSTIQSAIDVASNGDTIIVYPDTYLEKIDFLGKSIEVKSLMGASDTIIDANGTGTTVKITGGTGILDGFTVTGGSVSGFYLAYASPTINNCIISGNSSGYGAGFYIAGNTASVTINDSIITDNSASAGGGGIYAKFASIHVNNTEISYNTSVNHGAGIFITELSNAIFDNCDIRNNSGKNAGGIYSYLNSGDVTFKNSFIRNNTVSGTSMYQGYGAGAYLVKGYQGTVTNFENCIITGNVGTGPYARGGAIYSYYTNMLSASISIDSCTIADNDSTLVGGVYFETSTATINNSILWGNTDDSSGDQIGQLYSTITVSYTDIQAGWTGTGNIDSDPLFVGAGDYHLQSSSPCINVGDTTLDVDFEATSRPRGSADDMGADEY